MSNDPTTAIYRAVAAGEKISTEISQNSYDSATLANYLGQALGLNYSQAESELEKIYDSMKSAGSSTMGVDQADFQKEQQKYSNMENVMQNNTTTAQQILSGNNQFLTQAVQATGLVIGLMSYAANLLPSSSV